LNCTRPFNGARAATGWVAARRAAWHDEGYPSVNAVNKSRSGASNRHMKPSAAAALGAAVLLAITLGAGSRSFAWSPAEADLEVATPSGPATVLERLNDVSSAIRLGLDVTPLRPQLTPPIGALGVLGGEGIRPFDHEARGTALSFDLTLAWPGAAKTGPFEPYVAVGPALFVVEPDYTGRLLGTRVDPTLRLGAKAGAGVNWRLGRHTTLFGAYEVMTIPQGGSASPGAKAPADNGVSGYDFTYGLRLIY